MGGKWRTYQRSSVGSLKWRRTAREIGGFFDGFCTSVDRRCSKCFIFGWFLYLRRQEMFQMFHFWMVFVPPSTGDVPNVPNVPNVSNITCSKLCTGRILPILRHEEVKGGRQRGETRGEREGRKKECKGLKRAQKFTGGRPGRIQMRVRLQGGYCRFFAPRG